MGTEERYLNNIPTNERYSVIKKAEGMDVVIVELMPRTMRIPQLVLDSMIANPHKGRECGPDGTQWDWCDGEDYMVVIRERTDSEATWKKMIEKIPVPIWRQILGHTQ